MTWRQLIIRYTLFAVCAMCANLAIQRIILFEGATTNRFLIAVAAGTLVGLVVKYVLDKRWIFYDRREGLRTQGRQFILYTAMSVATTGLFWGTETVFWLVWQTDAIRELGAVLGLSVGYIIKYRLDARFVFTNGALYQRK